jgi:hypothetical protein
MLAVSGFPREGNITMTDGSYTHICFIADRSGSMGMEADPPHTKAQRSTEGIHAFVKQQKELPGKVTFTLMDFDTLHRAVEEFGDGSGSLAWTCEPRNGTALLDAVGQAITQTGTALAAMPEGERPGMVYVVIATDGEENSSVEYKLDQVKAMVTEQQDRYGWQFSFIGADIDAFSAAGGMGMNVSSTLGTSSASIGVAYAAASNAVYRSRGAGGQSISYTDDEREAAK